MGWSVPPPHPPIHVEVQATGTKNVTLFEKNHWRCNYLKWARTGVGWTPNSIWLVCLFLKGGDLGTDSAPAEHQMNTGVMLPQAKE